MIAIFWIQQFVMSSACAHVVLFVFGFRGFLWMFYVTWKDDFFTWRRSE